MSKRTWKEEKSKSGTAPTPAESTSSATPPTNSEPAPPAPAPIIPEPPPHGHVADPDPWDIDNIRLKPEDVEDIDVEKVLLTVPHDKPNRTWFVRAHPDPAYRVQTKWIDLGNREQYLVAPNLWPELATETVLRAVLLVTAISRQNIVFLWPMPLATADGRNKEWSRTGMEAIERATKRWVRVQANMALGGYEVMEAKASISEPVWPKKTLRELMDLSFGQYRIDTLDHPIIRQLRGEA
jgi:hypothetical protein